MAAGKGGCWQKCIDLIWELQKMGYDHGDAYGGRASQEQLEKFWYFVELDLGEGKIETEEIKEFEQEKWDEDYQKWRDSEPGEVPQTIMTDAYDELITVKDKDKAQWYSNIWNDMNNSDVEGVNNSVGVYTATGGSTVNGHATKAHSKNEDSYITNNYFGTPENENYIVIPDDKLNDPVWLSNIISDGFAVLQVYVPKEENLIDTSVAGEGRRLPPLPHLKSGNYSNAAGSNHKRIRTNGS